METYVELQCHDGSCGMYRPAFVKKTTVGDKARHSALKKRMKATRVKIVRSCGEPYMDHPLMLDMLLLA